MLLCNRSICFLLTAFAALVTGSDVLAQDAVGEKQRLLNTESDNYQKKSKFLYSAVKAYNDQAKQAKDEREKWLPRYMIYDNVISHRGKDAMMAYIDQARKELGVSELEGYRRIGKYNPYTGESYIRYYDPKTGELVLAEVRATHKELEQARDDFEKTRQRLRASRDEVSKAYQDTMNAYKQASAAKKALDDAIAKAKPVPPPSKGPYIIYCVVYHRNIGFGPAKKEKQRYGNKDFERLEDAIEYARSDWAFGKKKPGADYWVIERGVEDASGQNVFRLPGTY